MYNIFSGPGRGPEIYGTEEWHFYIRNLLLNFNIWFMLAVAAFPLFTMKKLLSRTPQEGGTVTGLRSIIFMSPFYLWLGIFSFQPHKEERFMYPMYPALALNAAMSLHIILAAFGQSDPKTLIGKIPARLKLLLVSLVLIGSVDIGVARIYGIYSAYSAPLKIYEPLQNGTAGSPGDAVCFGKEWYRFPSSFHLPNGMKAKFVKSEFDGLLPGEFSEANTGFGFWSGAWLTPPGMNDLNQEDMGKYVGLATPLLSYANWCSRLICKFAISWLIHIILAPRLQSTSHTLFLMKRTGRRSNASHFSMRLGRMFLLARFGCLTYRLSRKNISGIGESIVC
jgi:alpha-1,2-mannosyltransferase